MDLVNVSIEELLEQIELYKENKLEKDKLVNAVKEHISKVCIISLEGRFGKIENIGSQLGFYEVADTIYDVVKKDFNLTEEDLDKDIYVNVPLGFFECFLASKKFSIHSTIEKIIAKIKDLHDRKRLSTIKYKLSFKSTKDMLKLYEDLKLFGDRIASIEKHDKDLIVYTYMDIQKEIISLLKDRYDCDLTEI